MKRTLLLAAICFVCLSGYSQNVGIGTNTPVAKVDVNGAIALREGPAIILSNGGARGGSNDNIVLSTIAGTSDVASFYRITGPTAAFSIYGIVPVGGADGQVVTLVNTSGQVMTLVNSNSSTTTNGILTQTGADLADKAGSTANSSITLQYNKTAGLWYVTAAQNFSVSSSSLATHNIVPGTGSAVTVTNGSGQVVGGGDVVVDVATNALNQAGIVAGPTATNSNQGWITDATGHPGWAAVNSAIVAKDITTSTNGVTLTNNTGQVVGASNMTINVATNSASSAGLVPAGSGNSNKVWGTDVSGNPSWNSVGNAQLANSSVTVNAGTGLSGGGTVALGGSVTLNNAGVTSLTSAGPLTTNTSATGDVTVNLTGTVPVGNLPNLAGDVTGAVNANTVGAIQGQPVANTTPTDGQVLEYNSGTSKWTPTTVGSSLFTAGTGLSWSGSTLNNTGVTSVGMSMPGIFNVSGSPVTTTGTLSATLANENANTVFAGPASGSATTPGFRSLTTNDLPAGGAINYFNFNNAIAGTAGWMQLGTITLPQGGYNAFIEMHSGTGYNASNAQNGYVNLYIRTSNTSSVDANGFAASAFAERFGFNPFISNIVLVANAAGVSATQYTVYINAGSFIGEGWYSVKTSNGSWTPSSTAGSPSGTTGSSTVCVVPFQHIVQNTFSVMNGNAGIGTTSPAYPVDAVGDINSSTGFSIGGTAASASYLRGNGSQFVSSGLLGADITGTVPVASIPAGSGNYVQNQTGTVQSAGYNISGNAYIGGNVGIGTTNPQEILQLNGNIRGNQAGALRISTGNGYVDIGPQNGSWSHFVTDRTQYYFNKPIYTDNGGVLPYTDASFDLGSSSNRWRNLYLSGSIIGAGAGQFIQNGTAAQSANFNITGYGYAANYFQTPTFYVSSYRHTASTYENVYADNNSSGGFHLYRNDGNSWGYFYADASGIGILHGAGGWSILSGGSINAANTYTALYTNSAERVRIDGSGNVGIGTTGPAAMLHVAGGGEIIGGTGSSSNLRTLTILNNGQSQVNFGAYPGSWTGALQIQCNDNSRFLWMSPLDANSSANSRLMAAGTGFDVYVNGSASSPGALSASFTNGNVFVNGSATIGTYGTITSTAGSYGTIALAGSAGGYYGVLFGQSTSNPNIMYDGSGNGGIYYQNYGWSTYYLVGTRHLQINTASDLGATLGVNGNINAEGNIINTNPTQGTIGLTGDLPGYATNTYPTLKTSGGDLYISVGGAYSAYITAGGVWTNVSSRKKKENFETLDKQDILNKINALEMYKWDYICEKAHAKHIAPIAEDFYGKFGLGECDSMISNIDPAGIALVGVQALSKRVDEIKAAGKTVNAKAISEIKTEIDSIEKENSLLQLEIANRKKDLGNKANAEEVNQLKAQLTDLKQWMENSGMKSESSTQEKTTLSTQVKLH